MSRIFNWQQRDQNPDPWILFLMAVYSNCVGGLMTSGNSLHNYIVINIEINIESCHLSLQNNLIYQGHLSLGYM